MSRGKPADPEFSRIVNLDELLPEGASQDVSANAVEREALARRFGLVMIKSLVAAVRIKPEADGAFHFSARLRASVVQSCVVTLEPVEEDIDEEVVILFRPQSEIVDTDPTVVAFDEDSEPLTGDSLDAGEIVAEELALALNPYPRRPDADATAGPRAAPGDGARPGPFAALATLRRREGEQ